MNFNACIPTDVTPVNTNPFVRVSLENKQFNNTQYKPAEPVFKCLFSEPTSSPYWYDTYWYINTDIVKVVESQVYMSNKSWLYPKDWVDKYDLNMVVRKTNPTFCGFKLNRLEEKSYNEILHLIHFKRKNGNIFFYIHM